MKISKRTVQRARYIRKRYLEMLERFREKRSCICLYLKRYPVKSSNILLVFSMFLPIVKLIYR